MIQWLLKAINPSEGQRKTMLTNSNNWKIDIWAHVSFTLVNNWWDWSWRLVVTVTQTKAPPFNPLPPHPPLETQDCGWPYSVCATFLHYGQASAYKLFHSRREIWELWSSPRKVWIKGTKLNQLFLWNKNSPCRTLTPGGCHSQTWELVLSFSSSPRNKHCM